jgi:ABC-type transporter Mla maintaining outer membrane lipid asymmetry ATPase subunit MlaF
MPSSFWLTWLSNDLMAQQISQSQEPVVEAVGASVCGMYSQGMAVVDLNWQVAAGEYWVVGGGHGSGKTALLLTLAGLYPPGAGVIRHFGQDLNRLSEQETIAQRLRVGFVFKNGGRMFDGLTVAENVALPLRYHRDWTGEKAVASIQALLETTELTALAASTAQDLTTGWQERVGLARALALEPEVLFLDEPMASLEPSHCLWWRGFLDQLSRGAACTDGRKMTLVATTCDFSLWSEERRHFALLKNQRWQSLGECAGHPKMTELM